MHAGVYANNVNLRKNLAFCLRLPKRLIEQRDPKKPPVSLISKICMTHKHEKNLESEIEDILNHLNRLVLAQLTLPVSWYTSLMIKQLDICCLPNPLSPCLCGRAQTCCSLLLGRQDLLFRVRVRVVVLNGVKIT